MHAKIITINVGCDGHRFEALDEELIDFLIVELLQDFRSECEVLCHGARLMITSQHHNLAWVVQLEAEEEDEDL